LIRISSYLSSPGGVFHRVFHAVVLSDIVSPAARIHELPAFIVNFCLKTGPDARKGFPVFPADEDSGVQDRCAAPMKPMRAGDPSPYDGRSGFVRADRNHKAGNGAGLTEKETKMSNTKKNEEAETKNPPVAKIRVDLINASIWRNKTEKGIFYNVTF
jgi:hypothetical protein